MKPLAARFILARLAFLLAAVLVVAACRVAGPLAGMASLPVGRTQAGNPAAAAGQDTPPGALEGAPLAPRYGFLRLTIKWPDRGLAGLRSQAIPTNTQSLALWVWAGPPADGVLVRGPVVVPRAVGVSTVSVEVKLPEGRNFTLQAMAYREASPSFDMASPIAEGTAGDLHITYGETTSARLVLAPRSVEPAITSLDPVGARGQTVTLQGTNLGTVAGATPSVVFNGATASVVLPVSSTSLRVVVPDGATTGNVAVTSDGLSSNSLATFWVLESFRLVADRSNWDASPEGARIAVIGQALGFHGLPAAFVAKQGEELSQYGASPSATMSVGGVLDNPSAGTFPASGSFLAGDQVAAATLSARLGNLTSANSIALSVEDVTGVTISPLTADIGGSFDLQPQFKGVATLTSGATHDVVTFTSSDPASVSIGVNSGIAAGTDGLYSSASVTITAASAYRPAKIATASATWLPATAINLGSWYSAAVDFPGDSDYFRFVLGASASVQAFTSSTINTYCYLLDSGGNLLAQDDQSGGNNQCSISRNLDAGTYYFRVRHGSSSGTGNYSARVGSL